MDPRIRTILRDLLCASVSLDDGLAALQGISRFSPDSHELGHELARALEEVLLRRPALANYKFLELIVRHSFDKTSELSELISLLDTRFTNEYRRTAAEDLPDLEALPILIDLLGELGQSMSVSLGHGLRPLLAFLADETLHTLDSIIARDQISFTKLAVAEVHYLARSLMDEGLAECAEPLLDRLLSVSRQLGFRDLLLDLTLDLASVLTDLELFDRSRSLLKQLESEMGSELPPASRIQLALQLAINETRDEGVSYQTARDLADRALQEYERSVDAGLMTRGDLAAAYLLVGSTILIGGWREAIPQAVERLNAALAVYESIEDPTREQRMALLRCLVGLGHAHSLTGSDDGTALAIDYLRRAQKVADDLKSPENDMMSEIASCLHAIGWACLLSESAEFRSAAVESFQRSVEMRTSLLNKGQCLEIALLSSMVGLGLAAICESETIDDRANDLLSESLLRYMRLFPSDSRALVEAAIALYDIAWLSLRHRLFIPERLRRVILDLDRMILDLCPPDSPSIVEGISLAVPLMFGDWFQLKRRALSLVERNSELRDVGRLMAAFATAKINIQPLGTETVSGIVSPEQFSVHDIDPVLTRYWEGQALLASGIRLFFENRNHQELAPLLHQAAVSFGRCHSEDSSISESREFILSVATSFTNMLSRLLSALEVQYEVSVDHTETIPSDDMFLESSFLLPEDWLGLVKITNAYIGMMAQGEPTRVQPYMNAVLSNISRAVRMMDGVAMVERRVMVHLGSVLNRRSYIRS
ncbi:MAG: hypothetical protein QXS20_00330 [Candidatus Thorarchaeota archaeon]